MRIIQSLEMLDVRVTGFYQVPPLRRIADSRRQPSEQLSRGPLMCRFGCRKAAPRTVICGKIKASQPLADAVDVAQEIALRRCKGRLLPADRAPQHWDLRPEACQLGLVFLGHGGSSPSLAEVGARAEGF